MAIRRVMVVDDDDDIRTVSEMALQYVGEFDVVTAASGAEALELAGSSSPDLILLDMMMPGMDGVETLEALRAAPKSAGIPVIFMTAKVQTQDVQRYMALGAIGVISKPFDPMTLAHQIRDMATTASATA